MDCCFFASRMKRHCTSFYANSFEMALLQAHACWTCQTNNYGIYTKPGKACIDQKQDQNNRYASTQESSPIQLIQTKGAYLKLIQNALELWSLVQHSQTRLQKMWFYDSHHTTTHQTKIWVVQNVLISQPNNLTYFVILSSIPSNESNQPHFETTVDFPFRRCWESSKWANRRAASAIRTWGSCH